MLDAKPKERMRKVARYALMRPNPHVHVEGRRTLVTDVGADARRIVIAALLADRASIATMDNVIM